MAINNIRFIGTGKPISPETNPRLDREASRKGVEQSGIKSVNEFHRLINKKLDIPPTDLGRGATGVVRILRNGLNFKI